jgi:hypothetical protein
MAKGTDEEAGGCAMFFAVVFAVIIAVFAAGTGLLKVT